MCWGDGFVTDPGVIAQYGLTDPNPFFNTVLTRPYANQVVISPHYYPPSISGQTMKYADLSPACPHALSPHSDVCCSNLNRVCSSMQIQLQYSANT